MAVALTAGAAQAQTPLGVGDAVAGVMPPAGPDASTCYHLRLPQAGPIEATVRSTAFDPMVSVGPGRDCGSRDGWSDDDGGAETGGPLDARLVTEPLPAGDYVIRVLRADGRSGPYSLTTAALGWTPVMAAVRPDLVPASFAVALPAPLLATTELDSGTPRRGTMSADAGPGRSDCYLFRPRSRLDLEVIVRSEQFDPVVVVGPGRDCNAPEPVWRDDNSGAASGGPGDARMVLENREAGDYFVRVDRADGGGGDYQVMAMTGSIHVAGTTALNSPTLAPTRNWQAEAREAARAEVATAVYNPPPRPAGYAGLSDGDLLKALDDSIGDGPGMAERLRDMDPVAKAWMTYHNRLIVNEYLAGTNTWSNANPNAEQRARRQAAQTRAEAQARADAQARTQAQSRAQAAAAAPPALRPGCNAAGECTYAVVAHMGDQADPYMASYEGTTMIWGIMVTDRPTPNKVIPFTICGRQVYASVSDADDVRGRLNPTSEALARRFSLSPYGGGFAICAWSPPRYTGPNR